MQKEKRDDSFIKKPVFKGGLKALNEHIKSHLKYPDDAIKHNIEGTVLVRFDIDFKGNVTEAKAMKGIGYGCDEEAVRIIKLMKFEVPKNPRKLKVIFHKDLQINFKLPKKPEIKVEQKPINPAHMHLQYNIITTQTKKKEESSQVKPQSNIYQYTINIK